MSGRLRGGRNESAIDFCNFIDIFFLAKLEGKLSWTSYRQTAKKLHGIAVMALKSLLVEINGV